MSLPDDLLVGTSSWTAPSWSGPFYPPDLPSSKWLGFYAGRFPTVEIDATWYRCPSAQTVEGWESRTPPDFTFSAKVPQSITHEKVLVDCQGETEEFLISIGHLGEKLGPVLFQFPYFKQAELEPGEFLRRLARFLPGLPPKLEVAVEVRNKSWIGPPLLDVLRQNGVAVALTHHPWMPDARGYARIPGILTTDHLYVRLLGNRHLTEELTTTWDRLVVDRTRETQDWVEAIRDLGDLVGRTRVYFNNHYAGCAYESAQLFLNLWEEPGVAVTETGGAPEAKRAGSLSALGEGTP